MIKKSASGFVLLFILRSTVCIPLDQFYPFGNTSVSRDDDNSSPAILLPKEFLFFSQSHTELYVNTNGVVSFETPVSSFTPNPFPLAGNTMLIAAFWGDVDTRGTGTVWYHSSTDDVLLNRASMDIRNVFPAQAAAGFTATGLFIATWDRVGYYNSHTDLTNTFQCVLVTDETQSFVMFLYADGLIQWTTGDSSGGRNGMGGIPAQVGFNAGDGVNYAAVPESRTADIINIADIPGILAFQVDGENITESRVPLPPPRSVTVSVPGIPRQSTTLIVNWQRPLRDQGDLSGYELCYVESSVGDCDSNGVTINITDPDQLSHTINDLSINTNYVVVVRARTEVELGAPASANGITDEDAPDPVMSIVTQFSPSNTIRGIYTITWTPPAPTNGSFYQRLEYSYSSAYNVGPTYNGSFSTGYLELDQSQNQFIFDALYYTDYNFTITAINIKYNITNGPSLHSNQSSPTVPTPVRNIKVAMSTSESIFITWDHPEYPNSQMLHYIFYYNDNPSMLQLSGGISTDGFVDMVLETMTSYNLTGLPPFTNYTILITVTGRDVGNAPLVMESLQRTNATAPFAPGNLTVNIPGVPHSSTTLIVNWEEPPYNQGAISGYELCYVESSVGDCDNNGVTVDITDPNQLSYTINDLSINTNYIVVVRGRTEAGLGDPASANGTTDEDAPDRVMNIVTQFSPNNTIRGIYTITWTPPAPTNGSFYQRLEYSYSSAYNVGTTYNGSFSTGYLELDQGQNQFIFDALYYTDYNFTITTINLKYNISNGPYHHSNQSSPTVPTPVRNIKVAMSTSESIFIIWDHPEYPNSQLLNYIFYYNDNPSMLQLSGGISTDGFADMVLEIMTSYNLTGLPPFTNYTVVITVTGRGVGNAPFVMESLQRTKATVPLAPENLTVSIPGVPHNSTTLIVNWEKPPYNQGALSGYELCYVESSVGDCDNNGETVNVTDPDQLSYTINDLSINTNYIVMVRARTEAGLGDSASANGTTDEDAPDPVMNIVTQFSPNNTIKGIYTITWTPPAPTNGPFYQRLEYSYSSAYNVGPTYNGSFSTGYLELDQGQNQFIFDALYYTDYNFTITTINLKYNISDGPSHHYNRSAPTAPTAVRNIKVAMSTPESIFVTWDHPEYPNSQLSNYIFYYNDNPTVLQSSSRISTDGFEGMVLEVVTSFNLTGLPPFTNYTILITVTGGEVGNAPFAMELLQRTNTTVPKNPPTPPSDIQIPPPSFGTISLTLPQPDEIDTGKLYLYAVVVVIGSKLNNSPEDIINSNGGGLPPPYPGQNNVYTAAVYTRSEDVPTIFVLGDDKRITGPNGRVYINKRLNENTMYGVFKYIRLESDTGVVEEGPLIVCSEYITVDSTIGSQENDDDDNDIGLLVGVSIASALVVLIVLIGIIIIAYYHWERHDKKEHYYDEEVAYTKSDNPALDNAYVPPQQYQVEFEQTVASDANEVAVNPHATDFLDNNGHKETD